MSKNGIESKFIPSKRNTPIKKLYKKLTSDLNNFLPPLPSFLLNLCDKYEVYTKTVTVSIKAGCTVIIDRYIHSSITDAIALGLPKNWVLKVASALPEPDIIILMKTNPKAVLHRKHFISIAETGGPLYFRGNIQKSFLTYQGKLLSIYKELVRESEERFICINGHSSIEKTQHEIRKQISHKFGISILK